PVVGQRTRNLGQRLRIDHACTHFRQVALRALGVPVEQFVGHGQTQHGVTQKLQAFIGRQAAVFVGVAAVSQRQRQQLVGQIDLQGVKQITHRRRRLCRSPAWSRVWPSAGRRRRGGGRGRRSPAPHPRGGTTQTSRVGTP